VGELVSRGLIDWSRAVTCAIRCGGWDAYLRRVAGGGLGVLLGGAVWMGTATAPAAPATTAGPGWCGVHTATCPSTVVIVVCAGA
jgi:hypothetical protein